MIRPRLALRAAAAIWGVAIAISAIPLIERPAPPGQLPGAATALGIDAHAPFRFVALLVVIPLLLPWVLKPALEILARPDTRRWARNCAVIAMLIPIWFVTLTRDLTWTIAPTLLVIAVCVAARRLPADFSRHDAVLFPTVLTVFFALIDIVPLGIDKLLILATGIVLAIRLTVVLIRRPRMVPPAYSFAIAPLGLILQSQFLARDQRHFGWAPLCIAILSPFALRYFLRSTAASSQTMYRILSYGIFPVVVYAYASAASLDAAEGKPRSDLYENANSFAAGAEMLRGKKPYRDIIPTHGLISDALLSYGTLRTGQQTIGRLLRVRGVVEGLNAPAEYLLAFAATGSPEVGLLSFFLADTLGTVNRFVRVLPALITLALLAAALRQRRVGYFAAAGVGVVLCGLTSLDFGVYVALTSIFAALLFRQRLRAFRFLAGATAAAAMVAFIALTAGGVVVDFFRTTFIELPPLVSAFSLGVFSMPAGLKTFHFPPEVLLALFDKTSFLHVTWVLVLVAIAATAVPLRTSERRRDAFNALRVIGAFILVCAVGYADRHHLFWQYAVAPLIVAALFRSFHAVNRFARAVAPFIVVIVLMIVQPTIHFAIVASLRAARGPLDADLREIELPRGRGAYFSEPNAAIINAAQHYVDTHLRPEETFVDFTNHGLLYFLLDRGCPIRQLEVAFYEPESQQRDVIARIERNPSVRVAVIPLSPQSDAIDGVPNAVRAPLVWAYLQSHFEPDVSDGGVAFWRRK